MTKEDNIFRMMNDIEIDHTKYEETNLSQEEKDKLFETFKAQTNPPLKPKRQNKTWITVAAALLLLIAGSQTTVGKQVQATAVSIIENIRYSLSSALGNAETETPGALSFNQTAQIGTAEVSIQDLVAFDHRLVFNLLVDMDGDIQDEHFMGFDEMSIQINGQKLNTASWPFRSNVYDKEENIHSAIYTVSLEKPISEADLINIEIQLNDIRYFQSGIINNQKHQKNLVEGMAIFSVDTTLKELNQYTNVHDIDTVLLQDDYEYIIEKMYTNPDLNYIEVYSDDKDVLDVEHFQLMEIRGKDENDREVLFEQTYSVDSEDYRKYSFSLTEENSEITTEELVNAQYLDLQFYLADWPEIQGTYVELEPFGKPFKVELNN